MNVLLYVIIIACLYLLAVVVTVYIGLYWAKVRRGKNSQKKIEFARSHQKALDQLMETGFAPQEILPRTLYEIEVLEEEIARRLKNDRRLLETITPFIQKHFLASYKKRLMHPRPNIRMKSLVYIDLFQLTELEGEVISLLTQKYLQAGKVPDLFYPCFLIEQKDFAHPAIRK